ncbi:MAG: CDP-alcohol phosphatidyltransferase family protein [Dysgonomonas mossii]|uniref:CDP-alcohol phosphatidyltransferase family protein n=1 Tax=Dysgonomonas mossii TaxID=163665 RepID=UPI003990FAB3
MTSFKSTLKSNDTEEFLDIYFYRPIGYCWVLLFKKLGITPNMVTIASIFIGIGAGVCFYFEEFSITILGILLLIWADVFDSADGQLARMTKNFSPLGRALDGFAGNLWFMSIYIAICLRLTPSFGWYIWIIALIAGYFHSKQASMADYYRNIHLFFLKGKDGSELDNSLQLQEQYNTLTFKKHFIEKVFLLFYKNYTRSQESWTPNFQSMCSVLNHEFEGLAPIQFQKDFRMKSRPLMKWTNILSFNTRAIALFIAVLIKEPFFYFVFELTILNLIMMYLIHCHEKICSSFTQRMNRGYYEEARIVLD